MLHNYKIKYILNLNTNEKTLQLYYNQHNIQ